MNRRFVYFRQKIVATIAASFLFCCALNATEVWAAPDDKSAAGAGSASSKDPLSKAKQQAAVAKQNYIAPGGRPTVAIKKGNYKTIELEGEVVDTWCWSSGVMGEGRGPGHKSCGLACVLGGVACGIVDDNDNLYIASKSQGFKGCKEQLAPYVAKRVHIKGWITERGGCKLLKIAEVKDLGPAEKFYKKK